MFNWMNRRLYHFLRLWLSIMGGVLAGFAFVAGFIWVLTYVESRWGMLGVLGTVVSAVVLVASTGIAWIESRGPYREELEEQRRVEKSLKKDWTR